MIDAASSHDLPPATSASRFCLQMPTYTDHRNKDNAAMISEYMKYWAESHPSHEGAAI